LVCVETTTKGYRARGALPLSSFQLRDSKAFNSNYTFGTGTKLHAFVAVSFFVSMALVCLFCANDTINLLPDKKDQDAFKRRYRAIGIVLLASPLAAVITSYALGQHNKYKFFIEAFGVWTFGYYWWTKSREFRITSAEKRAAQGMLENAPARGVVPVTK